MPKFIVVPQSLAPVLDAVGKFTTVWYSFFTKLATEIPQVGDIIIQASGAVGENYLACDGSAVSRTTYAELFATIGIAYGPGDGVSTFNLPNLVSIGAPSFWKIRFQ